jgi:hypothetical protein
VLAAAGAAFPIGVSVAAPSTILPAETEGHSITRKRYATSLKLRNLLLYQVISFLRRKKLDKMLQFCNRYMKKITKVSFYVGPIGKNWGG